MKIDLGQIFFDAFKLFLGILTQPKVIGSLLFFGLFLVLIRLLKNDFSRYVGWSAYRNNPTIPDVILNMSGLEFENWVQGMFQKAGVSVKKIGGQKDHGVDLEVYNKGEKMVVQCKKYYPTVKYGKKYMNYIGEPILRDLYGTQHGGGYQKSILITTGYFSKPAYIWAKNKPDMILIGRKELREIIKDPNNLVRLIS